VAETAKAREVDAANAQLDELTAALATLQGDVTSQAAEVEIAARRLDEASALAQALEQDVADLEALVEDLEFGLSDQAIRSFMGGDVDESLLAVGSDPTRAIRKQSMLAKATQTDIDYVANLSAAREDLRARRADADAALASAEAFQTATEEELRNLEDDQAAQIRLTAAAESRLDHLLVEQAALERLGADLDAGLDPSATQALVNQLANAPLPAPSTVNTGAGETVSQLDIRDAGKGIEVHVDIVDDIRRLLIDAAADGIDLAGGGYRDPAAQIRVRQNNCGTSYYAVYEMPSSQCRPPTARPGRSQHEQGKAIDFTYNGRLITSRSGPGWEWLKANAAQYGLYNLPSEPWHWSVNGR
jgi:LAS superfamily LD-carboxypeptidase LdcB